MSKNLWYPMKVTSCLQDVMYKIHDMQWRGYEIYKCDGDITPVEFYTNYPTKDWIHLPYMCSLFKYKFYASNTCSGMISRNTKFHFNHQNQRILLMSRGYNNLWNNKLWGTLKERINCKILLHSCYIYLNLFNICRRKYLSVYWDL